ARIAASSIRAGLTSGSRPALRSSVARMGEAEARIRRMGTGRLCGQPQSEGREDLGTNLDCRRGGDRRAFLSMAIRISSSCGSPLRQAVDDSDIPTLGESGPTVRRLQRKIQTNGKIMIETQFSIGLETSPELAQR